MLTKGGYNHGRSLEHSFRENGHQIAEICLVLNRELVHRMQNDHLGLGSRVRGIIFLHIIFYERIKTKQSFKRSLLTLVAELNEKRLETACLRAYSGRCVVD